MGSLKACKCRQEFVIVLYISTYAIEGFLEKKTGCLSFLYYSSNTSEVGGPMQGVGSKRMLTTLVGQGGGGPYGAVQHWHGTGLVGHSRLCRQQSHNPPSKLYTY
jgi:hypothetical protein